MKFPLVVQLTNKGYLEFTQDISKYDIIRKKKETIDAWVLNNDAQWEGVQTCHRLYLLYNKLMNTKAATRLNIAPKTQVIYIPAHLMKFPDILNKEILFGFVTSVYQTNVYCRFYSSYNLTRTRTESCSEIVPIKNLFILNTRRPKYVNEMYERIAENDKTTFKKYLDSPESNVFIRNR